MSTHKGIFDDWGTRAGSLLSRWERVMLKGLDCVLDDFALRSRCCAGNPYAKMETGNVAGRETNENAPAF